MKRRLPPYGHNFLKRAGLQLDALPFTRARSWHLRRNSATKEASLFRVAVDLIIRVSFATLSPSSTRRFIKSLAFQGDFWSCGKMAATSQIYFRFSFGAILGLFLLIGGIVADDVSDDVLRIQKASNQTLLWGPYRPNVYFGIRPRIPKSLLAGLMWYRVDDYHGAQTREALIFD